MARTDQMNHKSINLKNVLFISIPLPGHLQPLVEQGVALAQRGWNVTIASTEQMRSLIDDHIEDSSTNRLSFMSLGPCSDAYNKLSKALQDSSDAALAGIPIYSWAMSSFHLWSWTVDMYPCMFNSLSDHINRLSLTNHQPSLVVTDFATACGIDVADHFHIPVILNNVNVLVMVSPTVLMPLPSLPSIGSSSTLQQFHEHPWMLFVQRLLHPVGVMFFDLMVMTFMQPVYNRARQSVKMPQRDINQLALNRVIMMNSAATFEYARALPAYIQLTGPMIDFSAPTPVITDPSELDVLRSASQLNTSVIVVAFGTLAPWSTHEIQRLSHTFNQLNYHIIWKLSKNLHRYVSINSSRSEGLLEESINLSTNQSSSVEFVARIFLEPWISNQLALLCDDRVSLFISHCGTHSVHEALSCGKVVMCIPQQGDQIDNAARLASSGAGVFIQRNELSANRLAVMIEELLTNPSYKRNAVMMSASMRLQWLGGGLEKAVSIIEHVNEFGWSHLTDAESQQPLYSKLGFDVLIVWLILISLLVWSVQRSCFARCMRRISHKKKLE